MQTPSTTTMAKGRRVQVTLPANLERKLILWAFTRDDTLPNWIKTVLRLRVDANWDKVQDALEERARTIGISQDELEEKILKQAGFDLTRELKELEEDKPSGD